MILVVSSFPFISPHFNTLFFLIWPKVMKILFSMLFAQICKILYFLSVSLILFFSINLSNDIRSFLTILILFSNRRDILAGYFKMFLW